ncbi:CDGSH iron-sulfur domain-containing protein 3, mitochondrial [Chelonus insularis]|uniref:CDGSH iron-sulfur domain-containing protein 3, mitochondrial n=1 Tax=Chelonus insularis TaxID=460826 RepID=UPI00158C7EB6|nr:CDGSH iron-sulfur domain-containing protein 3, mitochondrial [Chelonus insularis]
MTMVTLTMSRTLRNISFRTKWNQTSTSCMYSSDKSDKESEIPVNLLQGLYSAQDQPSTGKVYDKKPFKIKLQAGKRYSWCLCGESKGQPLCDRTHQNIFLKIKLRPIFFEVKETKYYWLCNCKRTSNRPFCDGTHLSPEIQELKKYN